MIKTLSLFALVVLVPFTNLRMICIDPPTASAISARVAEDSDCSEMCPRLPASRPQSRTGCVLLAGDCSVVMAFVIGLPVPSSTILPSAPEASGLPAADPRLYVAPITTPFTPPPEL